MDDTNSDSSLNTMPKFVDAYLDNTGSPEQMDELVDWLKKSDDNVQRFVKYCYIDGLIEISVEHARITMMPDTEVELESEHLLSEVINLQLAHQKQCDIDILKRNEKKKFEEAEKLSWQNKKSNLKINHVFVIPRAVLWVATIGFVFLILAIMSSGNKFDNKKSISTGPIDISENSYSPLTKLLRVHNAVWYQSEHEYSVGDEIRDGLCGLKSGLVEILMVETGAVVLIEGPSTFEVINKNAINLVDGKLTALVKDEKAKGFYVDTIQGRIVDYGTEFGVSVNPINGTRAIVFEGEIGLQTKLMVDQTIDGNRILKGQHSNIQINGYIDPLVTNSKHYDTPDFVRIKKLDRIVRAKNGSLIDQWYLNCENLREHKNLVYYFNGALQDERKGVVLNQALGTGIEFSSVVGKIVGAKWSAGRWGVKSALKIDDAREYVSLNLPGDFKKLTMMACIKFSKNKNSALPRAIFNTDDDSLDKVHFQMSGKTHFIKNTRSVDFKSIKGDGYPDERVLREIVGDQIQDDDWHQLVSVIDGEKSIAMFYLDGVKLEEVEFDVLDKLRFGESRIGGWAGTNSSPDSRPLNGKIDSLMIFNEVLSDKEIYKIYKQTMKYD